MDALFDSLVTPVAAFLLGLVVSVWIIPIMIRLAPRIGMIDAPDPRKVHRLPIARVGGVGIALGAMLGIELFAPGGAFKNSFLLGGLILSIFGAWDDATELGHYPKFLGQIAAAAIVIWYGNVWIHDFPFFSDPLPEWIGKPFTLVAVVGVINAINHSDGLDGLAGGESLLSLGAMCCLAYLSDSSEFLVFSAAVGGGLLGFVRFNTWPARVFMGDLGSQFLGFSVGVLAIALTQQVNVTTSKSVALLLVGLPIVDILAVLYQRIRAGMNWFKATRNHIHHRLLDLGFDHYQAVLIIYTVQGLLNLLALFVAYEAEWLILVIYCSICASVFVFLYLAERAGWRIQRDKPSQIARFVSSLNSGSPVARGILLFIQASVPVYMLLASASLHNPQALTPLRNIALALIGLLALTSTLGAKRWPGLFRLALYCTIGIIFYCIYQTPAGLSGVNILASAGYFLALGIAILLAAAVTGRDDFTVTNLDFLIVSALVAVAIFSREIIGSDSFWAVAIAMTVLFYACELIILRGGLLWDRVLGTSAAGALGILIGKVLF